MIVNVIICALLWGAVATLVLWDSCSRNPRNEPVSTNPEKSQRRNQEDNLLELHSENHRENSANERHQCFEKIYWLASFTVTALALGGAVWGVMIAKGALKASQDQAIAALGQLDSMRQQQRPWLRGTYSLIALSRDDGGINFTIDIAIKNVGNYPAQIVFISGQLIIGGGFFDEVEKKKTTCKDTRNAWVNIAQNPGNSVFPGGENVPWPRTFGKLWEKDIRLWRASVIKRWGPLNEGNLSPERQIALRFVPLAFVGCITYGGPNPDEVKQTGFILELSTGSGPLNIPNSAVFDLDANGPYNLQGVSLIQAAYGGDAN